MSRVACRLAFSVAALAVSSAAALAADLSPRGGYAGPRGHGPGPTARLDPACRAPEIVTAYFKEQVCHTGQGGYAECRWVSREHDVRVPASCDPEVTSEDVVPATRGAFPPYGRLAPKN